MHFVHHCSDDNTEVISTVAQTYSIKVVSEQIRWTKKLTLQEKQLRKRSK